MPRTASISWIQASSASVSRLEMDGSEPATIAKLRNLLEARKKAIERIHSLAIIDERGNWLTSPGTIGSTLNDDAFFRYHQLSPKREPHVGRPVKSLLDGEWVVTLSRRFNKLDGSFGGVVLATISSGYLSHFYEQFELGRNSSVALTHGDGLIIARNPSNDRFVGRSVADTPLFRDAALQRPGAAPIISSRRSTAPNASASSSAPAVIRWSCSPPSTRPNCWRPGVLRRSPACSTCSRWSC
ncbi:hypothetical protein ACVWZV_008374 [Bradyrhizobium sp. GM5.1]